MHDFSLNLICVGFDEGLLGGLEQEGVRVFRKGDIWRKRTGQKYQDNIARLTLPVTHDSGYGDTLDRLITRINNEDTLSNLLLKCREVEVQFSASLDNELQMPHLHLTAQQLHFLSNINAEVDIHLS